MLVNKNTAVHSLFVTLDFNNALVNIAIINKYCRSAVHYPWSFNFTFLSGLIFRDAVFAYGKMCMFSKANMQMSKYLCFSFSIEPLQLLFAKSLGNYFSVIS